MLLGTISLGNLYSGAPKHQNEGFTHCLCDSFMDTYQAPEREYGHRESNYLLLDSNVYQARITIFQDYRDLHVIVTEYLEEVLGSSPRSSPMYLIAT